MVQVKSLTFAETKRLPSLTYLREAYGISFNAVLKHFDSQEFEIEVNGFTQILSGGAYCLQEFIDDYYEMDLATFRVKFYKKLQRRKKIIPLIPDKIISFKDVDV